MISFFTLLLIFSSWTQIKVYGIVFTRFAGVWSAQSFCRGLARSCCAAMCAHSDANNALLSPQPAKSVTCAPALVCPMALARPLAQLCNNKSLQPVPNPFCRHKWAGLGLTHLANRKRCWLVPLFFAKDPSRIVDIEWLWFMLFSKYKTAKDCPRTGQEQAYTGIT